MTPQSITSAWLREYRPAGGVLPLSPDCAAMLADALELADDGARSWIETECKQVDLDSVRWWDMASEEADCADLSQALRYLEARGLVERRGSLVRMVDEAGGSA